MFRKVTSYRYFEFANSDITPEIKTLSNCYEYLTTANSLLWNRNIKKKISQKVPSALELLRSASLTQRGAATFFRRTRKGSRCLSANQIPLNVVTSRSPKSSFLSFFRTFDHEISKDVVRPTWGIILSVALNRNLDFETNSWIVEKERNHFFSSYDKKCSVRQLMCTITVHNTRSAI